MSVCLLAHTAACHRSRSGNVLTMNTALTAHLVEKPDWLSHIAYDIIGCYE